MTKKLNIILYLASISTQLIQIDSSIELMKYWSKEQELIQKKSLLAVFITLIFGHYTSSYLLSILTLLMIYQMTIRIKTLRSQGTKGVKISLITFIIVLIYISWLIQDNQMSTFKISGSTWLLQISTLTFTINSLLISGSQKL